MNHDPSSPERLNSELVRMFNKYRDFLLTQPEISDDVYMKAPNEPRMLNEEFEPVRRREMERYFKNMPYGVIHADASYTPRHIGEEGEIIPDGVSVSFLANNQIEWNYYLSLARHNRVDPLLYISYVHRAPDVAVPQQMISDGDLERRIRSAAENYFIDNPREFLRAEQEGEVVLALEPGDIEVLDKILRLLQTGK